MARAGGCMGNSGIESIIMTCIGQGRVITSLDIAIPATEQAIVKDQWTIKARS